MPVDSRYSTTNLASEASRPVGLGMSTMSMSRLASWSGSTRDRASLSHSRCSGVRARGCTCTCASGSLTAFISHPPGKPCDRDQLLQAPLLNASVVLTGELSPLSDHYIGRE